jgi:conjugal transfer ATP-binding protein TraC
MSFLSKTIHSLSEGVKKAITSATALAELKDVEKSATQAKLKALSQKSTVSQLLFYRYSEEYELEGGEKRTVYVMDDQRKGFIIEVQPPTFLTDSASEDIYQFFNAIITPNVVVHINTFASRNIEQKVRAYEAQHPMNKVNIGRRDILKELISHEANAMRGWVNEPMGKNGVKARQFVNTISVLFPRDTDIKEILNTYTEIENVLAGYHPTDFKPKKLIATVAEFLRPDDLIVDEFHDIHQKINSQMAMGSKINLSEDDGTFKVGENWEAVTLTTEKFPRAISAFEFQSAFFDPFGRDFKIPLTSPFVCSLVVSFDEIKKNTKQVLAKASSNIGQLNYLPDTLEKKKPILRDKREENEDIVHNIIKKYEVVLKGQWTLTVYDKNKISQEGEGWLLKEENYSPISFQSFLMGLPLQYSQLINDNLRRFKILFKSNNAQIAPLISGSKSWGSGVMMFTDRTGNVVFINLFDTTSNSNFIIVGRPGTGKSVIMNRIAKDYLGHDSIVRIIDIGDSYRDFTYRLGGKFIEADDENTLCLNFFTNIITEMVEDEDTGEPYEKVHGDELTTIVPLIGCMLKLDLRSSFSENDSFSDASEKKVLVTILEDAIQEAYNRQKRAAGMQTIWEVLKDYKELYSANNEEKVKEIIGIAVIGLHDYVKRDVGNGETLIGKNYHFFNGVNNLEFEKDLFTFEMEKLTRKGEDILEIVSMSVMHQIANEAYFIKGRRKIIGVDESKILLAKPMFARFLDDFSRRLRKYGGALGLLTQYVNDFFINKDAQTLFEGATFKFFPEQSSESIEDAIDTGKLSLSDGGAELLKSVKSKAPYYNELCVKVDENMIVLNNKLEPLSYWLYTTKPEDKEKILHVEQKYNLEESEGAWMCGLLQKGWSEESALEEILSKRKLKVS